MTTTYTTLLLGFALGLAALIPLVLHLRPRFKAAGYARGHAAGRSEQYVQIQALHDEVTRHKHIRDIERQGHQQRLEAVMQDCDDRIAIFARRSNPLTQADEKTLRQAADTLRLAAETWQAMAAAIPAAARAKVLQAGLIDIAERCLVALIASGQMRIERTPVVRDADGYWTHPHLPEFSENTSAKTLLAWETAQELESHVAMFEYDAPADHPYYTNGSTNISDWHPTRPEGDGWFLLSIHDTENNGPMAWFARRTTHQADLALACTEEAAA